LLVLVVTGLMRGGAQVRQVRRGALVEVALVAVTDRVDKLLLKN
jgi:hypothetical protein